MSEESGQQGMPPPDFNYLVQTFFLQTMISAGKMPNPATQETAKSPSLAKFNIGMLEVLQEKTKGNLSDEEAKLLEECLHQARMVFVEVQGA